MGLPRVLIVPYLRGWSYDHTAQAIRRHLAHRFEFRVVYSRDIEDHHRACREDTASALVAWRPDVVVDMWWHGTLHLEFDPARVLKQISSHRWATSEKFGRCSPAKLLDRYAANVGGVVVPSRRLHAMLTAVGSGHVIGVAPKGFDPAQFFDHGGRRGELEVGWVGAAEAADKNVSMLLEAEPRTRLADRCLTYPEMADFYSSIDIIAIASSDEGDPRPLIEGMASGCFPISTDVGIAPELIQHGVNGLIVERTVRAFSNAIAWCRARPTQVRDAGRHNAAMMRARRTWAHVMPTWGDAIDGVIERAARPRLPTAAASAPA